MSQHEYWMQLALEQAKIAESKGEVPVGAVVVLNNELVAAGHNCPISNNDPSMHAEICAMREAGRTLNNYRLTNCDIYVTLEPCMMCLGAMLHARIKNLYFGARDPKTGAVGGLVNLHTSYNVNHKLTITSGILQDSCSLILKQFFQNKRSI